MEEHLLTKVYHDSKLDFIQYNTKIQQVTLELTVLDYDMLGGSDAIGKVIFIYSFFGGIKRRLGPGYLFFFSFKVTLGKSRKKLEKKHWVEMVDNPRRPIIHWHQLREPDPGDKDQEENKDKIKTNG